MKLGLSQIKTVATIWWLSFDHTAYKHHFFSFNVLFLIVCLFACLFSESSDSQETKKLKYRYNTTKTLEMARVFLVKKDNAEKEEEEVGEKKIIFLINKIFKAWYANRTSNLKVVSHFFSTIFQLIDNQVAPNKWQFTITKYINFCMHVALTYLWTCLFWGKMGANGIVGVVVAWHKAELINFSNQFDFLTSFTNLLHLSLNISNIIILFWGSGIGRWVWPDIRAEVIAFSNQFYFLTCWTNIYGNEFGTKKSKPETTE